jgi:hypothetical protein
MPDVRDKELWELRINLFRQFAREHGAELQLTRLPNGKETVVVRQWYVPRKEHYGQRVG